MNWVQKYLQTSSAEDTNQENQAQLDNGIKPWEYVRGITRSTM